jgi:ATP-dependent DNA helicase DinG
MATDITETQLEDFLKLLFTDVLPQHNFPLREKQAELAGEILRAMFRLDILLAEAEVGIGKTLAYLIPAVLIRRSRINSDKINTLIINGKQAPVVIATSSIALQRALMTDYIPTLSDILMSHNIIKTPLTATLRKGKAHYLCERRFAHFSFFADRQLKQTLRPLMAGSVVDLAIIKNITPYIKRNICVDEHCNQDCSLYGKCRYTRFMHDAMIGGYDFQVVNHNYLLADILRRSTGQRPLIPDCQAVVIDEGHKFVDAARSMYGSALSFSEFCNIVKDVRGFTFARGQAKADILKIADKVYSKSRLLFKTLGVEVPAEQLEDDSVERFSTGFRERAKNLLRMLKDYVEALAKALSDRKVINKFENRYHDTQLALTRIKGDLSAFSRHKELVYWLEEDAGTVEETGDIRFNVLRGVPKKLGDLLYRDLWQKKVPIIITSGTLSAAGSFEHLKKKMGLNFVPGRRLRETAKPSPFDYKNNALLYLSENTPFPDNDDRAYISLMTNEIERLILASRGHAAVLFTSYKAMGLVYADLTRRGLPFPLFRLERGSSAAIERFRRSGNGVLFASGSLWEGIDLPGDVLSMLIIARLPFAVPDPLSEWEQTLFTDLEEFKSKVVVPEMLIKLKQGFGRLIRIETDTGVVAILDFRAGKNGAYRSRVLAALPPCRVTSSFADIDSFMLKKKTPEYFV